MEFVIKPLQIWIYKKGIGNNSVLCRYMSTSEITAALKPFYFFVHPDLFGQHPVERDVNDRSLKTLSSFIETVKSDKPAKETTLTFYLRPQTTELHTGNLKCVQIQLKQRCVHSMISSILTSCNLPTTYVDSLNKKYPPAAKARRSFRKNNHNYEVENEETTTEFDDGLEFRIRKSLDDECLSFWLKHNAKKAKEKIENFKIVHEQVNRLQSEIKSALGLKNLILDCGWSITHYKGCLSSFQTVIKHHPEEMYVLKDRILVFGSHTGVSFEGHILLNSGEVRHNWLDFIKRVPEEDQIVRKLPAFEKCVSMVLLDIQVVRRKFQPKTMAEKYENNLRRLTTSLSDYRGRYGYPKHWPDTLKDYELVVESAEGPLMVSPTGQFIVPSSCPSSLLVNFITDHLEEAKIFNAQYQSHKHVEKDLTERCVSEFQLGMLYKDDCIMPRLMIHCCSRLLDSKHELGHLLNGAHLYVTNYYSIMSDGQMCIPWNWKL